MLLAGVHTFLCFLASLLLFDKPLSEEDSSVKLHLKQAEDWRQSIKGR